MHRLSKLTAWRIARFLIALAAMVSLVPISLGSLLPALAVVVGGPSAASSWSHWQAWLFAMGVLAVHLALILSVSSLALFALRGAVPGRRMWWLTAIASIAMGLMAIPWRAGDHYFIGYSWPAILAAIMLLAASRLAYGQDASQADA